MLPVAFQLQGGHTVKLLRTLKNTLGAILGTDFWALLVHHLKFPVKEINVISRGYTQTLQAGFGLISCICCPACGDEVIM